MKIVVTHDDGQSVDITKGVQVLYDQIASSMDWGSGFLDYEEVNAIRAVGYACGFEWLDYELDVCAGCGHKVGEHRDAGEKRTCRKGWATHTAYYVAGDMPGSWLEVNMRMTGSNNWHAIPRDKRRRIETIVDTVGCSCAGYVVPSPVVPPEETA